MEEGKTGLVLGKFLPPHLGHKYLVDFARNYVSHLTVVVGTLKSEPIPGDLRYQWMRELFPTVQVVHLTDENPQHPDEHSDFWQIWHDSLRRIMPHGPDFVFASEDYGWKLAEVLGASYVPVDISRELVHVSGTAIRNEPLKYWEYLPDCVRPYFLKRVCIFGPESTGKSTLSRMLAEHFKTRYVSEYARIVLEINNGRCELSDIEKIARGQIASEEAMSRQATRVLFSDTDLTTTVLWSKKLFQTCPPWIEAAAAKRQYDLYLLLDADVPWVGDKVRYLPQERESFVQECRDILSQYGRSYELISGGWNERFRKAVEHVEKALTAAP